MTTLRTHFTFRVDTWIPDGESIVEHIAGVEDVPGCGGAGSAHCDVRQGNLWPRGCLGGLRKRSSSG
jgi:hypothetical protein